MRPGQAAAAGRRPPCRDRRQQRCAAAQLRLQVPSAPGAQANAGDCAGCGVNWLRLVNMQWGFCAQMGRLGSNTWLVEGIPPQQNILGLDAALRGGTHACSALTVSAGQGSWRTLHCACFWSLEGCKTGSALGGMLTRPGAQAEKRQKTELSRREPEAPACAGSSSTAPLLQAVSVRAPGTVTSKERNKANREERAAERKALALQKEKLERWAAWRR